MQLTRWGFTALVTILLAMLVMVPATAQTETEIALDDADLSGWTEPGTFGPGQILVDEGEAAEQTTPAEDQATRTEDQLQQSSTAAGAGDVIISGAGWGHGIGMSQYGSYAQALAGRSHSRILASYYPGSSLVSGAGSDRIWVNLEQELVKVVLTAKQLTANPVPITVTHGARSTTLRNGDSVTIAYTGLVGGVRQCAVSGSGLASSGPCSLDLGWDGWATNPTIRVVIDKVWYHGSPTSGEECTHSVPPYTLECAYSRGTLHVRPDDNDEPSPGDIGFHVVVEIDLDDYVLGIGEVPYSWPTETLKTQAVASRTYAAYLADFRNSPSDRQWCWCNVYDQSTDQVYLGWGFGTPKWVGAVHTTDGQLLTYRGSPVAAFYGSSNGGATENNEDIWNGAPIPVLRSRPDVWSLHPNNSKRAWDSVVSASAFASTLGFSSVSGVDITSRYASGTPSDITVNGTAGGRSATKHFDGPDIRAKFGLRSARVLQIRGPFDPGAPSVDRKGGADRYETAVALSWDNFASGSGSAVVIARGDTFPDALSAAPLAADIRGPVLLTQSTSLGDTTAAELERLKPSQIYIVGGTSAVSNTVAQQLAAFAPVSRLAGADRYATAVEVSNGAAPSGARTVFIASGTGFPDAVSGSAQAAAQGSPLLLTTRDALPAVTRSEIDRLNPTEIVVVGGSGAVSAAVVNDLRRYATTVTVLAGTDRYDTSSRISRWGNPAGAERVFLATGTNFPDALAGAAIAGAASAPMLLTGGATVPASVQAEIQRLNPSRITLVGGPGVISYRVQDSVDDL